MTRNNVVSLWADRPISDHAPPGQLSLFGDAEESSACFSFVDLDGLDQAAFLNIIARNAVSTIIDLRPVPVFKRPKYIHRDLVDYFSCHEIIYFEYAMAEMSRNKRTSLSIARTIHARRQVGLTICVHDEMSREKGWLDVARYNFRRSKLFSVEVHPRSLNGYSI